MLRVMLLGTRTSSVIVSRFHLAARASTMAWPSSLARPWPAQPCGP